MAVARQDSVPVIEVTEPVKEALLEKKDCQEPENFLQMIIDQQQAKRKRFVFKDKDGQTMSMSISEENKNMLRGDSSEELPDYSSGNQSQQRSATTTGGFRA